MGNSQAIISREKLSMMTSDTKYVMDKILEYMLKELTVRDFVLLSNKDVCSKYVLFKANTLYKYFYELEIIPTRDKRGVIAFRKFDDIRGLDKTQYKPDERKSLCIIIAYYYTRIFQIYGALALTLIDDSETAAKTGLMSDRLFVPGHSSYVNPQRTRGGGLTEENIKSLRSFSFLRSYLESRQSHGFRTKYKDRIITDIFFEIDSHKKDRDDYDRFSDNGMFSILYGNNKTAFLHVNVVGGSTVTFKIKSFKYRRRGVSIEKPLYDVISSSDKSKTFRQDDPSMDSKVKDYFDEIFEKISSYVDNISDDIDRDRDRDRDRYRESDRDRDRYRDDRIRSESGADEKLKIKDTITVLQDKKIFGHCIARALQLLQTVPASNISSICDAEFISRSSYKSIPKGSLDSSTGLSSLALLFYDTIQQASIRIGIKPGSDGRSTLDSYIDFMKKMSKLFGSDVTDPEFKSGLKGLTNKRDRELCNLIPSSGPIQLSPPTRTAVLGHVNKLFQIQFEHAKRCGGIVSQLFNIQRDKFNFKISLHPNVLAHGFVEIERINKLTRDVLVDYYSNCETTYLHGVQTIINSKKPPAPTPPTAPAPAAPGPPAPPPAAPGPARPGR